MSRVVVVGAGMAGLAVAARLAALGHRVTVCEQAGAPGGKLGWYAHRGFAFDTGPSLLTAPQVYRDLFTATGGVLEDSVDLVRLDPVAHYRFGDGSELTLPDVRHGSGRAVAAALGPRSGQEWTALLARAERVWRLTHGRFLTSPLRGPASLLALARDPRDVRTVAPLTSLHRLGRRHLTDERLRVLLNRYATYAGSDPRRAPAALATIAWLEQAEGAWYCRGGLRTLALAVAGRAAQCGVVLRTGCDVAQVLLEHGRAVGVRLTDGGRLGADLVVADVDATHLYRDLLPRPRLVPPGSRRSYSGFVLLLALRGRTPGLCHHTVLFPPGGVGGYLAEFDDLAAGHPVHEPAVYVSAPDDPALRPDAGHEAWFVLVNAPCHDTRDAPAGRGRRTSPPRGTNWRAPGLADRYGDHVLGVLARRGLDVRDRLLWRVIRTPADLEASTRSPGGAIYGSSSDGPRAAFLRPANRSPVPGLFLVGGSAHPGGGLPLVAMSAAIVAGLVGPA